LDVIPERIFEAWKILSALFFGKDFEENKLELERKVILNEIAEMSDNPQGRTEEILLRHL
jgi:predicted Zn-dependent peptidase